MNLAHNAVQHTRAGDRIGLGAELADGTARLWVHDSGPGVPAHESRRIFERFARGEGARRGEGAGLGLAIVRAIAEAHGGRVELRSPPGDGATFTIVVPAGAPAA
jgi:signal transduction histidine kinase